MNSYEIIQTHILFCEIRKYLEGGLIPVLGEEEISGFFKPYDEMKTKPMHVHKKKNKQEKAVLALGKCLTNLMDSDLVRDSGVSDYIKLMKPQYIQRNI